MLKIFLELLATAKAVVVNNISPSAVIMIPTVSPETGEPENQVVLLKTHAGLVVRLTEEGVQNGRFDPKTEQFKVFDDEGDEVYVRLLIDGNALCPPDGFEKNQGPAYVVVQEGGSSTEMYVHSFFTTAQARAYQASAAEGSYRTSNIITVPDSLANHPSFQEVAIALATASLSFEYNEALES